MPTSNNSLEFVMDKHCEMVSHSGSADQTQFSGIAFDPLCDFNQEIVNKMHGEVVLQSVTDVFVNHANMEWTRTLARNPAVTNLLSLRSFLPTEVNEAITKTIVAQKPKTNLLEKVDPDSAPIVESIGRGSYQKYNQNQVNKLFSLVFLENQTAAATVRETEINVWTAQNYVRLTREKIQTNFDVATVETDESNGLETMEFFENKPDATLEQARIAVMEEFSGLQITKLAIQKHLVKKCALTMKKLKKLPEKRDNVSTIEMRQDRILEWQQLVDFNYLSNCVFIDEAGFNMHIKRTFGCSVSGTPAKTTVLTQRDVSITILGAMFTTKKKRKLDIYTNVEVNGQIGTRTQQYLDFLSHTMDVLDSHGMQGCYLSMDNASIYKTDEVKDFISSRGYKCIYLSVYSPFLIPMEEMWSKIKFGIRREEITESDELILRITESAKTVTLLDCLGWINHVISIFSCCLNRERKL
ncbi:hypothetical protein PHYBLDRAFT_66346 [Phycomyces blakesleeanus NRRL 1555(-)]|uniref:Tc1-like transposase DDE domain-containing protein n=1 Tax=Phycomyces blakesleeanus (strain ATCC 8743b / DSM 1359 / FGSC 10004 / NBRC 33097 / NRRL 1555) TaxID=763407 RepID=A0A162ZW61_PHYB8|nr:hypothetical protein PHYBLDRAFT_66346 [Phycomyces blakesleeanus NRRL 1555(-)]OAD69431.1 hypothetical protein PHYBLDRAFT_66346 [Phycomyces blakesleeanus NRRL 1555(-)]|eukprot:XP_018287471.1 hypothetical protein PHYBLDRAFT_66346 [Phycomyces blakesleeanus NRRL 1555(-)]